MSATKDKDAGSPQAVYSGGPHQCWYVYLRSRYSQRKVALPCPAEWQDRRGYFQPLTGLSNFLPVPVEPEERRTWGLTSLDVKSITTYWEASECCCSRRRCFLPRRCFPRLTCQRRFPPTSPFCPCGWSSDGGASYAGSSWARAHQCKRCGGLQESKTADEPTDTVRRGETGPTGPKNTFKLRLVCRKTNTHPQEEEGICVQHLQKMDHL